MGSETTTFLSASEERFKTFVLERLDDFIKNLKSSLDVFCIFVDLLSKNDFPLDNRYCMAAFS